MPHHLTLLDLVTTDSPAIEKHMSDPLDQVWLAFHARNLAAHTKGREAARVAAVSKTGVTNPYGTGDEQYWFNEGLHGRAFAPITDMTALVELAAQNNSNCTSV